MKRIIVDNIEIDELKIYHQLRDNAFDELNSFVADSPKVVNILLQSDLEIKSILATREYFNEYKELIDSREDILCYEATKEQMQKLVGHKIHHNCMAHGVRKNPSSLEELGKNIIMLDKITSTENVGSIARSMAGFNIDSYMLSKESPHPYGRRALRVSMGYVSKLKYFIYDDIFKTIERLKQEGYKIYAAEITSDSTPLKQVKPPQKWVLIMGREGHGISKEVLDMCDEVVHVEMAEDVKSFNVSVAASVMMYTLKNFST